MLTRDVQATAADVARAPLLHSRSFSYRSLCWVRAPNLQMQTVAFCRRGIPGGQRVCVYASEVGGLLGERGLGPGWSGRIGGELSGFV